ncbi:MAG: serine/threonine protein kinase [Planctomycetes bacterium]|nr:serine/threonine protein kinase [Planctomycetota bacterium]
MSAEGARRAEDLFLAALDVSAAERPGFLRERCGDDDELRVEVESLLAHHVESTGFLETPIAEAISPPVPERIGDYAIRGMVGEGGMGVVYLAEQENPRRTVALKMIRPGLASRETLRRFEREARLIGRLQHPGIAQIFEAGTADAGLGPQPFFAMELIRGRTLIEHAESERLGIRERLSLFVRVCVAVEHAHRAGVIHRDLKPSNVLVDATGQPKVIDFGVARATDSGVEGTTLRTDVGRLMGTLPYMSPEQCAASPESIDARSDVYALGVIGYELLTGKLPLDVGERPLLEAARIVREDDATPLSSYGAIFRGDLETIFAKALEKDRARRYASAGELARDVDRFLRDEPIFARPASTFYHLDKFARRNRALVAGVAAAFVTLASGIVGTTWQWRASVKERRRAESAETLATRRLEEVTKAKDLAQARADESTTMFDFLRDMLVAVDPKALGRDVKVVDVLDAASKKVDSAVAGHPVIQAKLDQAIGVTYDGLGRFDEAEARLRAALALRRGLGTDDDRDLLAVKNDLGQVLTDKGEPGKGEEVLRPILARLLARYGESDALTLAAMNNLTLALFLQKKLDEAESLGRRALELRRRHLGDRDAETLVSMETLAEILQASGRFRDAETLFKAALAGQYEVSGADDPYTIAATNNLSALYEDMDLPDRTEPLIRRALDAARRVFGPQHVNTCRSMHGLALHLYQKGSYAEAADLERRALPGFRLALGDDHEDTRFAMRLLARALRALNQLDECEERYREVLAAYRRAEGDDSRTTIAVKFQLAVCLMSEGKFAEANGLFSETLESGRHVLPPASDDLALYEQFYGRCLRFEERFDEAEPHLLEGYRRLNEAYGARHDRVVDAIGDLVNLYEKWGKPEKAAEYRVLVPAEPK